ncbi:MAG: hypothetical protein ACLSCQ_06215 [Evtepia gabavorous]
MKEEGLAGVSFTPAVQRVGSGTLAPHVLGRVGQMSPEEWEVYQDRGYAMDETVGKDGAEGPLSPTSTAPRARRCWRPTRTAGSPGRPTRCSPRRGGM